MSTMSEEKNVCEKSARVTQRLKARKIWIGAKAKRRSKGATGNVYEGQRGGAKGGCGMQSSKC